MINQNMFNACVKHHFISSRSVFIIALMYDDVIITNYENMEMNDE